MNFTDAFKSAFNRAFDYETRSSRSEYWWFVLAYSLIITSLELIGPALGLGLIPAYVAEIAFIIPIISLTARRLHDVSMSGWWQLIAFTILGIIPLLIWYCSAGHVGRNKYGSNPLEESYNPSQHNPKESFETNAVQSDKYKTSPKEVFRTKSVHSDKYEVPSQANISRSSSKSLSNVNLLKRGFKVVKKVKDK